MGTLFARLHGHGAAWQPPPQFSARAFTQYISRGERQLIFLEESIAGYHLLTMRRLRQMHETVTAAYAALDPADFGVIHCDLWTENIKLFRGRLVPPLRMG